LGSYFDITSPAMDSVFLALTSCNELSVEDALGGCEETDSSRRADDRSADQFRLDLVSVVWFLAALTRLTSVTRHTSLESMRINNLYRHRVGDNVNHPATPSSPPTDA
jgi:hypothetical protein